MAAKLTRLTHKIAIQLHLVAESYTVCISRSRRPVLKLFGYNLKGTEIYTACPALNDNKIKHVSEMKADIFCAGWFIMKSFTSWSKSSYFPRWRRRDLPRQTVFFWWSNISRVRNSQWAQLWFVWGSETSHGLTELDRDSPKVSVWCALVQNKSIGPFL
jgi:hypothetical protein